jgi:hypothetical protein
LINATLEQGVIALGKEPAKQNELAGTGNTAAADRDGFFRRRGRSRGAARGDLSA